MKECKSLYALCLEFCLPRIENYARKFSENLDQGCKLIENLAGPIVEDLLNHAFHRSNYQNKLNKKIWKDEWKIFFTSKVTSTLLKWDKELIFYISNKCKNLQKCEVVLVKNFESELVLKLPKSVKLLDFDGELMRRGQVTEALLFEEDTTTLLEEESWLPQAERILKALKILGTPPANYLLSSSSSFISDLHLGNVKASASDLKPIILNCPNLRLLRHYHMVTALYELHSGAWKKKQSIPKYNLKNLDVDFSHVVRCRMSPEWVLSPDALRLAVALCPLASSVRVRFDCSTPHDVLSPLVTLSELEDFSAVCVSSGEKTMLDFSDMAPIFEKHGERKLTSVELKVIEEVEIHVLIEHCTNLEALILSGCGYITPSNCLKFRCQNYKPGSFKKLRRLFYADGDDFSWDHGVPDCFWKATLHPSGRLQGLFLESPKISSSLFKEIFHSKPLPFPRLQVFTFFRFDEITFDEIASICGLSTELVPSKSLKYCRLSECDKVTIAEGKILKRWMKKCNVKVKVVIDCRKEK